MPKSGRVDTGAGQARSGRSLTPSRHTAGVVAAHSKPIVRGWKVRGVRVGPIKVANNTKLTAAIVKRPSHAQGIKATIGIAAHKVEASVTIKRGVRGTGTHWASDQPRDRLGRFASKY